MNTARLFFEHHACRFQEIDQQQDIGKDVYVDLAERRGSRRSALRYRSSPASRTARARVCGSRGATMRTYGDGLRSRSSVIVHDPDDSQLRWVDLTGYLRAHPDQEGGTVPVSGRQTLDELTLRGAFTNAVRAYGSRGTTDLVLNLLSPDPFQTGAMYDAWALSRSDPKYLLLLRRFLMELQPEATRRCIWLLSHVGSHPNIFFTKDNWIKPEAKHCSCPHSAGHRKSSRTCSGPSITRTTDGARLGECLDVLLYEDPNIVRKLHIAITFSLKIRTTRRP